MIRHRILPSAALLLLAAACNRGAASAGGPPAGKGGAGRAIQYPVEVAPVQQRQVDYSVSAVGSVEAFEQVQITARVAGVVESVKFVEGDRVEKGTVLAEIDPDRYRVAVDSAKAALEKGEAALADAQAGLKRRESLNANNPGLVREEDLMTFQTRTRTASAEVEQARAALRLAELNLRDAYVRALAPGVIQTRTVQTGQYAQPGLVLATLVRRDPLLLKFTVPEQDALRLRPGMVAFFRVGGLQKELSAKLSHVAEVASTASRMVTALGRIEGGDPALRPGSFAEVRVPIGGDAAALVIPQTAVRPSERGFLAFVVQEGVARERNLTLGMRTPEGGVEILHGLEPGEQLVVRGAEALKEGAPVRIAPGEVQQLPAGRGGSGGAPGAARPSAPGPAGRGGTGASP